MGYRCRANDLQIWKVIKWCARKWCARKWCARKWCVVHISQVYMYTHSPKATTTTFSETGWGGDKKSSGRRRHTESIPACLSHRREKMWDEFNHQRKWLTSSQVFLSFRSHVSQRPEHQVSTMPWYYSVCEPINSFYNFNYLKFLVQGIRRQESRSSHEQRATYYRHSNGLWPVHEPRDWRYFIYFSILLPEFFFSSKTHFFKDAMDETEGKPKGIGVVVIRGNSITQFELVGMAAGGALSSAR